MSEWNIYNLSLPEEECYIIDIEKATVTYVENRKLKTRDMKENELVYDMISSIKSSVECVDKKGEEGSQEGSAEGSQEGSAEGSQEGSAEGSQEGSAEGDQEGSAEGDQEGSAEGDQEGAKEEKEIEEIFANYKKETADILKEIKLKDLSLVNHFGSSASYENKWIISAREFSQLNGVLMPPETYTPAKGDDCRPQEAIVIEMSQINIKSELSILRFLNKYGLPYHTKTKPYKVTKVGQERKPWDAHFDLNECYTSMKLSEFRRYIVFVKQMVEVAFQLSGSLAQANNNKLITAVLYLLLFADYSRLPIGAPDIDSNAWLCKLIEEAHIFLRWPMHRFKIKEEKDKIKEEKDNFCEKLKSVRSNLDYLELFIEETVWRIENESKMVAYYEPLEYSSESFAKVINLLGKIISVLKEQYVTLEKLRSTVHTLKNDHEALSKKRKLDIEYTEELGVLSVPECTFRFDIMSEVYFFAQQLFCTIVNSYLCLFPPSLGINKDYKIAPYYRPSSLEDIMFLELYYLMTEKGLKRCIACDNVFTGFNRHSNMKYCSVTCKNRIGQRVYRKKHKNKPTGTK